MTKTLARFGVFDYLREHKRIFHACRPRAGETRIVKVLKKRPPLVTESIDLGLDGEPLQVGIARFSADHIRFVFEP